MIYKRRYGWHKDVFLIFSNMFFSDSIKHYFTLIVETFEKNKNIFVSLIASFVNHCYNYEGAM